MESKNKKEIFEYYEIIIKKEGDILIEPFGMLVNSLIKIFKIPEKNIRIKKFCG